MIVKETNSNAKLVLKFKDLTYMAKDLYNEHIFEWVGSWFSGHLVDFVMSLTVYPLDLQKLFNLDNDSMYGDLRIDTYTLQGEHGLRIEGYDLLTRGSTMPIFTVGTIDFRKEALGFGEYNDVPYIFFEPYCTIDLYLPYLGFISIPPSNFVGKVLEVKYGIDFDTRVCTAFIFSKESYEDNFGTLIMTFDGSIGYNIALTHDRSSNVYNSIVQTAVKVGGAIMSYGTSLSADFLNAETFDIDSVGYTRAMNNIEAKSAKYSAEILSNTANLFNASNTVIAKGQFTGNFTSSLIVQNSIMYAIFTLPKTNIPANYNHLYGRPLMKYKKLNEVHGYTEIAKIHLQGFSSSSKKELALIENILKTGIILP